MDKLLQPSLLLYLFMLLILFLYRPTSCRGFTVIMSDSAPPAAELLDTPQTGIIMRNGGGRTDAEEQRAVYEVMAATGNAWAAAIPDVCKGRWHGIECMPDADEVYHVVSLSFGALSDDTAFPTCDPAASFLSPSLTRLPHLRSLFFYRCLASNPQPIPHFLGRLAPTLHSLVLRDNGHVGAIPAELSNLTHLRVLDLHSNQLSSSIPAGLSKLARLRLLDLSSNRLSGAVPDLPVASLNVLDLSSNLLAGLFPASLGDARKLIKVDISRNRLVGPIPDTIAGLESLMLLDLSYNLLSGPMPSSISELRSVRGIVLKGNCMSSTAIPSNVFSKLEELDVLVLSDMCLAGPVPSELAWLPALRVLHLDGNRLEGRIPPAFRRIGHLSELWLDGNRLAGTVPFDRETVWRMRGKLRLANNSGLCYEDAAGGSSGDATFLSGVGSCSAARAATTQRVASVQVGASYDMRSGGVMTLKSPRLHVLVSLVFFWFLLGF